MRVAACRSIVVISLDALFQIYFRLSIENDGTGPVNNSMSTLACGTVWQRLVVEG